MSEIAKRETVGGGALAAAALSIVNARTRGEYTRDVQQYLEHCQTTGAALAEGLESWKGALRSEGLSVASINRKLSGVKTVLRRAADSKGPEVRRGIEAGMHKFIALAPSSEASRDTLLSEGFENAESVAQLFVSEKLQK